MAPIREIARESAPERLQAIETGSLSLDWQPHLNCPGGRAFSQMTQVRGEKERQSARTSTAWKMEHRGLSVRMRQIAFLFLLSTAPAWAAFCSPDSARSEPRHDFQFFAGYSPVSARRDRNHDRSPLRAGGIWLQLPLLGLARRVYLLLRRTSARCHPAAARTISAPICTRSCRIRVRRNAARVHRRFWPPPQSLSVPSNE